MRLRSTAGVDPFASGTPFQRGFRQNGDPAEHQHGHSRMDTPDPVDLLGVRQGLTLLETGDDRIDPLVVSAFDPTDPYVANIRTIRTKLLATAKQRRGGRQRLAVLSIRAGDEGAIMAANLAVVLAQLDGDTVLIDADLRSPSLDRLFRLPNRFGLSELLSGQPLPNAVQPTCVDGLWLVPAGQGGDNSSSLLEKGSLAESADGWPLPAARMVFHLARDSEAPTDFGHVLHSFDAVVLVVRRGVTMLSEARSVIDDLDRRQVPIAGQVLV